MNDRRPIVVVALMATVAGCLHAEIISSNLPVPLLMHDGLFGTYYPFDLNGDSITDFTFGASPGFVGLFPEPTNRLVYRASSPPNLGGPVASLATDFSIGLNLNDSSVAWGSNDLGYYTVVLVVNIGSSTDFNGRGYAGLEFSLPDGTHYGYFYLGALAGFDSAYLYGWAYETTPGMPIAAGAVPEPCAVSLVTLGLAFVLLGRRVRQNGSTLRDGGMERPARTRAHHRHECGRSMADAGE